MENFGLVEADTAKAIELDPTYPKGTSTSSYSFRSALIEPCYVTSSIAYYRRAAGNMVLEHWDKAIKDLKEVRFPSNPLRAPCLIPTVFVGHSPQPKGQECP